MAQTPPKPDAATEERTSSPEELRWTQQTLNPALRKSPEQPIGSPTGVNLDEQGRARFTTVSGAEVRRLYTAADLPRELEGDIAEAKPGHPPYTRGIHPAGYRGKLWTMRQFSGFA